MNTHNKTMSLLISPNLHVRVILNTESMLRDSDADCINLMLYSDADYIDLMLDSDADYTDLLFGCLIKTCPGASQKIFVHNEGRPTTVGVGMGLCPTSI